ncbi:hypothetical protein GCM10009727_59490 [Actinomadura napierensis]|uniref:Uncharacterized protein n=1 Tax=Actinomadura napierensis TaxID=267854 RepID=A0ABN3A4I3_9ACTN
MPGLPASFPVGVLVGVPVGVPDALSSGVPDAVFDAPAEGDFVAAPPTSGGTHAPK